MSLRLEPAAMNSSTGAQALRDEMRIGGEPGIGGGVGGIDGASGAHRAEEAGSFAAVLESTAMAASAKEHQAVRMAGEVAEGKLDDLHGTMITMKEADISMKLVGNVRDKLLDAFHELWRINV